MFQHIGIEMWFYKSPYSYLFVFESQTIRDNVYNHLHDRAQKLIELDLAQIV